MSSAQTPHASIVALIDTFVSGDDRSTVHVNKIETALDDLRTEDNDETVGDIVIALALYSPGGGEFLLDEAVIVGILTRFRCWLVDEAR